jgi:hypothetical protein
MYGQPGYNGMGYDQQGMLPPQQPPHPLGQPAIDFGQPQYQQPYSYNQGYPVQDPNYNPGQQLAKDDGYFNPDLAKPI